jgi:4-amino-4-deoxy-L-arabinose transferase-like glycosyltransferase
MRERLVDWERFRSAGLTAVVGRLGTLGFLVLSFCLAYLAQNQLDQRKPLTPALAVYGLAILIFAALFFRRGLETKPKAAAATGQPVAWETYLLGMLVGILSFLGFAGNRIRLVGLIPWLGGLLMCLASLDGWSRKPAGTKTDEPVPVVQRRGLFLSWEWLALLVIVIVAAFFRLYRLDQIPADIGWDLPHHYFDVQRILKGEYSIFFPANQGREGMYFYLVALTSRFIGLSFFTLKLTPAWLGLLTVPVFYLAARQFFGREVGLYAALLLAVGQWHVAISRVGFRVILLPLFAILSLYFLGRALETRRSSHFGLLGLVLGFAMYTYKAAPFLPLGFLLAMFLYVLLHRQDWRFALVGTLVTLGIAFIVYVPMARYGFDNPASYFQREQVQVNFIKQGMEGGASLVDVLAYDFKTGLLMFNYVGDPVSKVNVPFHRHLGFGTAVLFALGLGYLISRWKQGNNFVVLSFWFVMCLPAILSLVPFQGSPSLSHSAGAMGPALIMAALPLALTRRWLQEIVSALKTRRFFVSLRSESAEQVREKRWEWKASARVLPVLLIVVFLLWESAGAYNFYFKEFVAVLPDRQNYSFARELARKLDDFSGQGLAYVKFWPHWYDGYALRMNLERQGEDWDGEVFDLSLSEPPLSTARGKVLFLVHPDDIESLALLQTAFTRWVTLESRDYEGRLAIIAFYGVR